MGTVREYGYREYPDDLTPASGGRSNLLFDKDRSLTTHATFHAVGPERDDTCDSSEETGVPVKALALVGALALAYGTVVGIRRAVRTARARRSGEAADNQSPTEVKGEERAALAGAAENLEPDAAAEMNDADDVLIEEVQALCEKLSGTPQTPQVRRATGDDLADTEPRTTRTQKRRAVRR